MSEFETLMDQINQFREERDWLQFHNPKDLALSLNLEAAELLENFQWKSSEEAIDTQLPEIKDELADVMVYALMFCSDLDIDPEQIIKAKLEKNQEKYPIEKAKGNKKKYHHL
ncbi:NTP pyrophosphatase, house-cleaning of non-canonical NTPs [Pelagirhabdus alkalitolerans]|uniref:NTP pyrophosphatase, house-cleaning of non-canonical NTPs n=1 Tax=Pelagirhabdus alkalitolerans TaxID=1612202 RepID=A0A1G6GQ77_9BACI|nr:nucleotide pyrophosphohydrolase [Pelagirhabdus alkalitolerans]SDB84170.1 NTP pyrophosphatase, house-cleaning of non-canonical NTPs [Pelagirhabdus alkalitolerans]